MATVLIYVFALICTVSQDFVYADFECDFGSRYTSRGLDICGIPQFNGGTWGEASGHGSHGNDASGGGRNGGYFITSKPVDQNTSSFALLNLSLDEHSGVLSFAYKFIGGTSTNMLQIRACGPNTDPIHTISNVPDGWQRARDIAIFCGGEMPRIGFTAIINNGGNEFIAVDEIAVVSAPPPTTTTIITTTKQTDAPTTTPSTTSMTTSITTLTSSTTEPGMTSMLSTSDKMTERSRTEQGNDDKLKTGSNNKQSEASSGTNTSLVVVAIVIPILLLIALVVFILLFKTFRKRRQARTEVDIVALAEGPKYNAVNNDYDASFTKKSGPDSTRPGEPDLQRQPTYASVAEIPEPHQQTGNASDNDGCALIPSSINFLGDADDSILYTNYGPDGAPYDDLEYAYAVPSRNHPPTSNRQEDTYEVTMATGSKDVATTDDPSLDAVVAATTPGGSSNAPESGMVDNILYHSYDS